MFVSAPTVLTQVQARKTARDCGAGAKRSSALPDLPTIAELALDGNAVSEWYGVVAPADTGAAQIKRVNAELREVLALPEVKDRLVVLGAEMSPARHRNSARSTRPISEMEQARKRRGDQCGVGRQCGNAMAALAANLRALAPALSVLPPIPDAPATAAPVSRHCAK